jgi:hypothetical protein
MILMKNLLFISSTLILIHAASIDYHKSDSENLESCLKKCTDNWSSDSNYRALEAGVTPILAELLQKNNLSAAAAIFEGFAKADVFFRPDSYESCIKECHYIYPTLNPAQEKIQKLTNQAYDKALGFAKEIQVFEGQLVNWSRKNKQESIHEQLKEFENKQGGLATRKDRFDAAISEFEAAFPEETQPKEDESEEF